mgnify:CR=1 FL=1
MKNVLLSLVALAVAGGSGYAYYSYRTKKPEPTVNTAGVVRGDIADRVGATGTLQAVTTVQVGTQVSGTIQQLHADFNSLVRKGQVLARLDPSLFDTQIEQARANLIRAQAEVERLRVALDDARTKLNRARELSGRQLIPRSELESAEVAVRGTEAQIRSSEAQVVQAQASLNQNQVNLQHTVIEAPIDGLVISRNVDVGQTVAASMQAPTLFVLAADLTKMQVVANLDESDVGRIRPGQRVTFRVDAYPAEDFEGKVVQVRLQPIIQQNVVTYATVIDVPNPDLKLKPGMTANVNVEIARRADVLRVPNTALRFRPTNDIYAALGQTPPPTGRGAMNGEEPTGRGRGPDPKPSESAVAGPGTSTIPRGGRPAQSPAGLAPTPRSDEPVRPSTEQAPASASQRETGRADQRSAGSASGQGQWRRREQDGEGGGGRGRGLGRQRMLERLQGLPPEERERVLERMRAGGFDPTSPPSASADEGASAPNLGGPRASTQRSRRTRDAGASERPETASLTSRNPGATTIDALFGPLPPVESMGRVWMYVDKQLKPVRVRLGISDGQATELLEGEIVEGAEVVTNVSTGNETRPTPTGGAFPPFMGQPGRFGGGPGGFGGGGFGGSGGRGGGR